MPTESTPRSPEHALAAPILFVSHGAPTVAIEHDDYTSALERFGASLERPRAVVVVSAHWEARAPVRIASNARPNVLYDFGGFPRELYELTYPAPGAPELAERIRASLVASGIEAVLDPARGWDHGVWVPLRRVLPEADVPVVAVSLPVPRSPAELVSIGRALAPLRDEGILLLASGGIVHNLGLVRLGDKLAPVDPWARAFDDWTWQRLEARELDLLRDYRARAPEARLAVPTSEHFDPLFVALGAARSDDRLVPVHQGIDYANLSMRVFALSSRAPRERASEQAREGRRP